MRIFIISNSLTNGGAERVGANLANIFVRSGHEVSLFTDLSQPATYAIDTAVTCYSWRGDLYNKVYKWFYAIRLIRRHIKADHPDIILGMMHLCSFIGRVAAVHSHVPVVLTIHHAIHHASVRYSLITRLADRWMPLFFSGTTVLTRVDADYYKSHDIPVFVMPNPLTFQPSLVVPKKEKMILAAGRLSTVYIKGCDLLIKAWSMIAADYPEWTLVIAGDGSEKDKQTLREMIPDERVCQRILLVGHQRDMLPWYQKAAVFVLSSRSEGMPMVLLEAMSQGCAPLATDNDGRTREIITNSGEGLICHPDVASLSESLRRLLADDTLRSQLQQGALRRSSSFSPDRIERRWEDLFLSLTNKHGG